MLNFVAEKAWGAALKAMGLGGINVVAKGVAFLMDKTLNMEESVATYYQLSAYVLFEDALRKIISDRRDYLRFENSSEIEKYNEAIALYKSAMIKGYDYSIIFYDACKTDNVDTDEIRLMKNNLIEKFNDFEYLISVRYDLYGK